MTRLLDKQTEAEILAEIRAKGIAELVEAIRDQRDESGLPPVAIGFHDLFCHNCDFQAVSPKPEAIEDFAGRCYDEGWWIWKGHAECKACALYEPPVSEEEERIDYKVYEARKW